MENNQINSAFTLRDLIGIFNGNKKLIYFFVGFSAVILTIIYFFVLDPIFQSVSVVKTVSKPIGLGALVGGGLPDISDFGDIGGGGSTSKELSLYESIILSRRCVEETIIRFKLNDEWEFKYMQEAIKNFRENIVEIKKDKLSSTMEIGVFDKNPVRAKEINEFLIQELNKINIELNVLNAKNNREFMQSRLDVVKQELKDKEDSLRDYQNRFGLSPELTAKATSQAGIQLEIEIKSEEVKLDILKKLLSPDQAEVKSQELKISLLKKELNDIKNSDDPSHSLNLKGAPDVILNYVRLQRNVEIQNKILTYIIPLVEQAKIEEKKEMPSVAILDKPYVPEKKVKPKRLTMVVVLTFLSFFMIMTFLVIRYKYRIFRNTEYNL